jgi:large subunit ribosomal protein L19e
MQLAKKKELAAKVLGVGKARILFVESSLNDIKEAITRQDILDLHEAGAIKIKEVKGRKTITKRKHRRGIGKVKKRVNKRKQTYVKLTRKLRKTAKGLLRTGELDKEKHQKVRKMIKAGRFKSKRHLNDSYGDL